MEKIYRQDTTPKKKKIGIYCFAKFDEFKLE